MVIQPMASSGSSTVSLGRRRLRTLGKLSAWRNTDSPDRVQSKRQRSLQGVAIARQPIVAHVGGRMATGVLLVGSAARGRRCAAVRRLVGRRPVRLAVLAALVCDGGIESLLRCGAWNETADMGLHEFVCLCWVHLLLCIQTPMGRAAGPDLIPSLIANVKAL